MAFYKLPSDQTVFNDQGTAYRTPEEFFAAGGAQDFSNVQTVQNLPFGSAKTLSGEPVNLPQNPSQPSVEPIPGLNLPQTITSDLLTKALNPTPNAQSIEDIYNSKRLEAGLPALQSKQQELLKGIQEKNAALEEGLIKEEGRTIATPIIGAREQVLRQQVARTIQPLVDTYKLNADQIQNIEKTINEQVGVVSQQRQQEAQQRQNAFSNMVSLINLQSNLTNAQRDDARSMVNSIITQFGGLKYDELPAETQKQLQDVATKAGFPVGILKAGLKTVAEQKLQQQMMQLMSTQQQREFQNQIASGNLAVRQMMADIAQQKLSDKFQPEDLLNDIITTSTGRGYVDVSMYSPRDRTAVVAAARKAGVTPVSRQEKDALQEIDTARFNQTSILNQVSKLLPKDASGRVLAYPGIQLSKFFQTEEQRAAYGSWRTAAIQSLRAAAGSKGLRINQAEIMLSVANDIPQLTDTVDTAVQRFNNVLTQLQNSEDSILVKNRSTLGGTGIKVTTPGGQVFTFPNQEAADKFKKEAGL